MSWYRRADCPGVMYFFTVVTYQRRRLFHDEQARLCLRQAWEKIKQTRPFEDIALCLLPNHLHCVWHLPPNDADFSKRWAGIKGLFTRYYLASGGEDRIRNASRRRRREAAIWQRRFWEHQIRNEEDLKRHVDYIHYNPVKHGLVQQVTDWPWSTYHRFAKEGYYGPNMAWDIHTEDNATFGE
jgi:putative transposase